MEFNYTLHGHNYFRIVSVVKYVGCNITRDLKWNKHIGKICNKANSTLETNSLIGSTTVKENAYTSLVRPTVEYGSTLWDPYQQNAINILEMVQCRAARYITNRLGNHSYRHAISPRLEIPGDPQERRSPVYALQDQT